eukprot:TRINITY_DN8902_c0_g1_i2.p1 TRINITY_DN8902_c0_g1~~TRINITY_DN8902_c0_g1_i2.p1  ORF type:complete len:181 (-),score=5.01 TRINITY_DN8902_c0_g1_i2:12-554(-)
MRQRRHSEEESDPIYMDTDEQKQYIAKMEESNNRTNKLFRSAFGFIAFILGLCKLYFAYKQITLPWDIPPHVAVISHLSSTAIVSLEILSSLSFMLNAIYLFGRNSLYSSYVLKLSLIIPVLTLVCWLFLLWNVELWITLWYVGSNICYSVLCYYVIVVISNTEDNVAKLYQNTYEFKKV